MYLTNLPPEVIAEIIHKLDDVALRTCSLVARPFLVPCQKRLFAKVHLTQLGFAEELCTILKDRKRISSYIRLLCLWGLDDVADPKEVWFNKEPALYNLLHNLPVLRHFSIHLDRYMSWEDVHPDLQLGILHLISLPTLVEFHLANLSLPKSAFVKSPQLLDLELMSVPINAEGTADRAMPAEREARPHTFSLVSTLNPEVLYTPPPGLDLTRLRQLHLLDVPVEEPDRLDTALSQLSNLDFLDWEMSESFVEPYITSQKSLCIPTHIRSLRVGLHETDDEPFIYVRYGEETLCWISSAFRSLQARATRVALETLTIRLYAGQRVIEDFLWYTNTSVWRELDPILSDSEFLPRFSKLTAAVSYTRRGANATSTDDDSDDPDFVIGVHKASDRFTADELATAWHKPLQTNMPVLASASRVEAVTEPDLYEVKAMKILGRL